MNKIGLSEQDIRSKYITPAITSAGWDIQSQIREEVRLTDGKIMVRGKMHSRGKSKFADYILYYSGVPLAIVEAKDNNHSLGDGMQQALGYAEMIDVPFAASSNGDGFLFHDKTGNAAQVESELPLESFPSPEDLWQRYQTFMGLSPEEAKVVTQPYYSDISGKTPRYYQQVAIDRCVEAIAKGEDRILLVLATGTGKTFVAFQTIWRLWKAGKKKRILFLADRNILVDQTKSNDFSPFGSVMTKVTNRKVDKAYEVYLSLYQAVTGTDEKQDIYKQFSPNFFDLIVIDECHRGSAKADSAWREILEYFSAAAQIGLTATPKETKEVSNTDYFGEPIYSYSLKEGIQDGFLAPYKVVKVGIDKDLMGWRPTQGQRDKYNQEIEDRQFNAKDMDRSLVIEKRTELVAQKITQYLAETDPYAKTIVFCENIDHAERMRQALVNANPKLAAQDRRYVMRITGDNPEGKAELDNFIDPESTFPVIAVTSKLMTTGVDSKTAKLIVLDQNIQSMTEFKQIIGRGTRVNEAYGKTWFTIMDFKKATELFADPDFDGDPVVIYEPEPDGPLSPPEDEENTTDPADPIDWEDEEEKEKPKKYYVKDVEVKVAVEQVQYLGPDGRLITESLKSYTKTKLTEQYQSLDAFLKKWQGSDKKQAVLEELVEHGVLWEALAEEVGKDLDPFDLLCHVAYGAPALTRAERANNVKKRNYFTKYGEQARKVLEALLEKYADQGVQQIEGMAVLQLKPLSEMGTPMEIIEAFGSKDAYLKAVQDLETQIYA